MYYYCQIISFQGHEAIEAIRLYKQSLKKCFEYLKQWDYGDSHIEKSEHNVCAFIPRNGLNKIFGRYVLIIDLDLDSVDLYFIPTKAEVYHCFGE